MRPSCCLVPVLAVLAAPALAEPWVTDRGRTRIPFEVEHLGFSTMPGIFREFAVDLDFEPEQVERSTLQVVVDTASIDRFHERLNEHLRSDDFFAVAGHPTMEARSTRVVPVEGAHAQVFGDLTLLGVTREIVLDVTLNELGPHPMSGQEHVGFSATARSSAWTTPRRPWAATWCSPSTGSSRRPRRPRTEPRPVVLEHPLLSVRAGETEAFEAAFAGASALLARQAGYRSHRLEDHTEGFRGGPDDPEWKARLHSFYEPFPEVLHFESVVRGASES